MNLIMNELQNSVSIWTVDATMELYFKGQNLSDEEGDNITDVWKQGGNRPIQL